MPKRGLDVAGVRKPLQRETVKQPTRVSLMLNLRHYDTGRTHHLYRATGLIWTPENSSRLRTLLHPRPLDAARRRTRKARIALLQDLSPEGRARAFSALTDLGPLRGGPINRAAIFLHFPSQMKLFCLASLVFLVCSCGFQRRDAPESSSLTLEDRRQKLEREAETVRFNLESLNEHLEQMNAPTQQPGAAGVPTIVIEERAALRNQILESEAKYDSLDLEMLTLYDTDCLNLPTYSVTGDTLFDSRITSRHQTWRQDCLERSGKRAEKR
jgi:hypothetical protein